jgi:hypothetical protein
VSSPDGVQDSEFLIEIAAAELVKRRQGIPLVYDETLGVKIPEW